MAALRTFARVSRSWPMLRLNAACPYYTMFPIDFPLHVLRGADRGDWVLDPFCGRGTTNFAARLRGLSSVGVDSNPVACAIAAVKVASTTPERLSELCRSILRKTSATDVPAGEFWHLCFHKRTLEELCRLREGLMRARRRDDTVALRALVLGILHGPRNRGEPTYLSNQMPRTYATKPEPAVAFWRRRGLRPEYVSVADAVERKARHTFAELPPRVFGEVRQTDSRCLDRMRFRRRFAWTITSPPYLGLRSYKPDQWLRNWFLGGPAEVDYEQPMHITCTDRDKFVRALARVWRGAARHSRDGARLVVRFGSLPSHPVDARALLLDSLDEADAGWRVTTIRSAGQASHGKRQAVQFGGAAELPEDEIDLYARLEDRECST